MYFVVLFLESFHSGVCKNNVGVLLVWSCVSLRVWTHSRVKHCSFLWALDTDFFIHQNITNSL